MNSNETKRPDKPTQSAARLNCADIRDLLFDYMSRELGESRSDLIREHLRKCPDCQARAAEIQETVDFLHRASRDEAAVPLHLTRERRAHIVWAYLHPVRDWIFHHHRLISILLTILILAITLCILRKTRFLRNDPPKPGPTVIIGAPPAATNTHAGRDAVEP